MPLNPEDASNINRFFTAIKSLNELDREVTRCKTCALGQYRTQNDF